MLKDTLVKEVDLFLLKPIMAAKHQVLLMSHLMEAIKDQKTGPEARLNLMLALQRGDIQPWIGVTGPEGARRIAGVVFTMLAKDHLLDMPKLVIYGLHMNEQLAPEAMDKCINSICDYAKKRGCRRIEAVTAVHGVAKLLERHGWTNGQSILKKEL
jgi:hypothetical protein